MTLARMVTAGTVVSGDAQALLRTERPTRVVEGRAIVDGMSIEVAAGDVLAVVGPSGSRKSSFLRLLDRLDEPTGGTVYLGGRDYRELAPRELRRRVGMVMRTPTLFRRDRHGPDDARPRRQHARRQRDERERPRPRPVPRRGAGARPEIETALALGAASEATVARHVRSSYQASLIPAIDNLRSLGIVWIPGMMAGMVLSGSPPLNAAVYQVVVLAMILSSSALTCLISTTLIRKAAFSPAEHFVLRRGVAPADGLA